MKKRIRRVLKKSLSVPRGGRPASQTAGQQTLQEILTQPATWLETARQFEQSDFLQMLDDPVAAPVAAGIARSLDTDFTATEVSVVVIGPVMGTPTMDTLRAVAL